MRHLGYRLSIGSLEQALWRVADLGIFKLRQGWRADGTWGYVYEGKRDNVERQRAAARAMRFHQRTPEFHAVMARSSRDVTKALKERRRRIEAG